MPFSERTKDICLAIVKIFETGKPLGDYSAVAVLDDGAGISYGTSQFTHRSGSLYAVLKRFEDLGGEWTNAMSIVRSSLKAKTDIDEVAGITKLKADLKRLGKDPLMQKAQREIAWEKYLKPAIDACEGSGFEYPLSLAVVYDSMNHGSYARIRDQVKIEQPGNGSMPAEQFEKLWITEYVQRRDAWLEGTKRLAKTDYRTDFFLAQIGRGNWQLRLPMNVHGYTLTEETIRKKAASDTTSTAARLKDQPSDNSATTEQGTKTESEFPPDQKPLSAAVDAPELPKDATEATVTKVTEEGSASVTAKNEQDVKEPALVGSPAPYQGVGFWNVIKRDLGAATGGNLSLSGLAEYAQQASGWPEWVIAIIQRIAVGVLIATIGYFVFRTIHYLVDRWQQNQKAKTEALAKTDISRKDIVWVEPNGADSPTSLTAPYSGRRDS